MENSLSELEETSFIHEKNQHNRAWLWICFVLLIACLSIFWGGYAWYSKKIISTYKNNPFLQVTNREMSLFLWQAPEYMRVNASAKSAYMPAFQYVDKVSLEIPFADDYVMAPPEVLFRYHTWHRLTQFQLPQRPISVEEFVAFLEYAPEWLPIYWPGAPSRYLQMIEQLHEQTDLAQDLPLQVRQAFQGWKNYIVEGDEINALMPTVQQVQTFLNIYPFYAKNYWQNIVGANYLSSLEYLPENATIPANELSPFLRVAIYNYLKESL